MANTTKEVFGKTPDGQEAFLFTLTNKSGLQAKITNYGGTIISLMVPDAANKFVDVVLGFDNLDDYIKDNPFFGCLVGRFANRIADGKFKIDDVEYSLAINNGPNSLHGGTKGFDKVLWQGEMQELMSEDEPAFLKLTYTSVDGEEGYPGNLKCEVTYTLTDDNELVIDYSAVTDKKTVINLTNHSYFNLEGHDAPDMLEQLLYLNADNYTVADENLIPTGEIKSVKDSPLDFTCEMPIGSRIEEAGGYDHNYIINNSGGELTLAARVVEPESGRIMETLTTQPGIQLYTANFLDGSHKGKSAVYNKYAGFCLETQHYPDSPNKPTFPSTILEPGQTYQHTTVYRFLIN